MGIMQDASRLRAGLFRDRKTVRSSAAVRRGLRMLRPMAEDLEGRTLLSVGLDPTYGFGGRRAADRAAEHGDDRRDYYDHASDRTRSPCRTARSWRSAP